MIEAALTANSAGEVPGPSTMADPVPVRQETRPIAKEMRACMI